MPTKATKKTTPVKDTSKKLAAVTKTASTKKVAPKKAAPLKAVTKAAPKTEIKAPVLVKYLNKNIKISPRKLALAVDRVRPLAPNLALDRLKFTNTKASRVLVKALKNVIADAKHNFNLDPDTLVFESIFVGESQKLKRMDKSHGSRFARGLIQKRHSRLSIIVKSKN